MASLLPVLKARFFTKDFPIRPLAGGKVYAYKAGTSTPKDTYTDSSQQTANTNPVILDSSGEANIWGEGSYKFIVKDANGVTQYTTDNVAMGNGISGSFTTLTDIASLRNIPEGSVSFVYVGCHSTEADKGFGTFHWDATSELADDNGVVIVPSSNPPQGRYIRDYTGSLQPGWFGGIADDSTDIHTAIVAMTDAALILGATVEFPDGTYKVGASTTLPDGVPVFLGNKTVFHATGTVTLTFTDRTLVADASPHFTGTNLTVVLPSIPYEPVYAEWFAGKLETAIAKLGSATTTLSLVTQQILLADLNIPANILLDFQGQSLIDLNGHALTINRAPIAHGRKIFDGSPTFGPLVEEIDALWFGPVGDDSTDNYGVLSAISTSVSNSGGGKVRLPKGTFRTSHTWYLPNNVTVEGQGQNVTVIKAAASFSIVGYYGVVAFQIGNSFLTLRDLTIDGNKAENANRALENCLALMSCTDVLLENCSFINCPQNVSGNGGDGLTIGQGPSGTSRCYRVTAIHCMFDSNERQGCSIICGDDLDFIGCSFQNTTGNNPGAGVDIEPNNNPGNTVNGVRFHDCLFYGNGGDGFQLYNAFSLDIRNIVIEGCTIYNNARYGVRGVYVFGGPFTLTDNLIQFNGDDGVNVIPGSNMVIRGNRIFRNTGYGIYMGSGSYQNTITENEIAQNGLSGIWYTYIYGGSPGFTISQNTIMNNSFGSIGSYHGIEIHGNNSHTDLRSSILSNYIGNNNDRYGTPSQGYGIQISDAACRNILVSFNSFTSNVSGPISNSGLNNVIEFNFNGNSVYATTANSVGSMGLYLNGGINVKDTTTAASYTSASVILAGGMGIGDNLVVKNTVQAHDRMPIYLQGDDPAVGFNAYYSSGWRYGAGSTSKFGGAISFDSASGILELRASTAAGNAGDTLTFVDSMYMTATAVTSTVPHTMQDNLITQKYVQYKSTTFSDANVGSWPSGTTILQQIGTMTGAHTVQLPAASTVGVGWIIEVADASGTVGASNKLTLNRNGSDTINGATSRDITTAYGAVRLVSDGTSKWTVV